MTVATDAELQALMSAIHSGSASALGDADRLLQNSPLDPRLHFLRGSMLIGSGRLIEAHAALSRAVELQPDFWIARFQLGFFELTSGEADAAVRTWQPLHGLPGDHFLRVFAEGLEYLIRDEFALAIATLEHGISLNTENPPLNKDIALLISKCRATQFAEQDTDADEAISETALLLTGVKPRNRFD